MFVGIFIVICFAETPKSNALEHKVSEEGQIMKNYVRSQVIHFCMKVIKKMYEIFV
jgi:hypothetical protein